MDQQVHSSVFPDVQAPHPIPRDESRHPVKKSHAHSYSLEHYAELVSIAEGWNINQLVNVDASMQHEVHIAANVASIVLLILLAILPPLMNKALEILHLLDLKQ